MATIQQHSSNKCAADWHCVSLYSVMLTSLVADFVIQLFCLLFLSLFHKVCICWRIFAVYLCDISFVNLAVNLVAYSNTEHVKFNDSSSK